MIIQQSTFDRQLVIPPVMQVRSAGIGTQLLLLDSFTDADGTALTSHTMDTGPGWTNPDAGTWQIQSNRAQGTSGWSSRLSDAGSANVRVSASVIAHNSAFGLLARATDRSTGWLAFIISDTVVRLYEANGSFTLRGTGSISFVSGQELAILCNGTSISVSYNGVEVIAPYTSTTHQAVTKHGFYLDTATTVVADNFAVQAA